MLRVRVIMTAGPITIGPDMTLREAAERLSHAYVSGAPVVSGDRVMGVISTTDIIDFIAATPGIPLPQDERTIDDVIEEDEDADVSMAAFYSDLGSGTTTDVGERMEQMPRPEVCDARHLALGKLRGRDARLAAAAAQRKLGQRRKRRFARSEALDQLVPADRTDVRRADQPDPRQPLGVRHAAPFFAPTRGSVPARSRAIFSRWRHSTITARPARPTA